jgi:hypothetical protein
MTKSTTVNVATTQRLPLALGTVVVHNYGEFTHGVIVDYTEMAYVVYFPADMSPKTPKYMDESEQSIANRTRTITLGKGFFVSRFKTIDDVRAAREHYKLTGSALEA